MKRRWLSGVLGLVLLAATLALVPSPANAITNYSKITTDGDQTGKITYYDVCLQLSNCRGASGVLMQIGYVAVHYYGPYRCTDGCKAIPLAPFGTKVKIPVGLIMETPSGGYSVVNPFIVYDTGDADTEAATIALGKGFVDIWCGVKNQTYTNDNENLVRQTYDFNNNYTSYFDVP